MSERLGGKPSDCPRDERFRNPSTHPFSDEQGMYHVFSYADVMRVLMNRGAAFSRDQSPWLPAGFQHMAPDLVWAVEPFGADGGEGRHDVLRQVVEPWFRTKVVRTMEPIIRQLTSELLVEIIATGSGELDHARDLAYRHSMRVICRLTGIDGGQEQWIRTKLDEFSQSKSHAEMPRQADVEAFFWQMVAKRLVHPQDELLDVLVAAWIDGRISDRELLGYLYGFAAAGTGTTGTSFVNAFALLDEFSLLDYTRGVLDDEDALGAWPKRRFVSGHASPRSRSPCSGILRSANSRSQLEAC